MPSPTMTRIRDRAPIQALQAEQRDYEHEDRANVFCHDDVRELTAAGEALGKALAQVKRALDRCNLTQGHSFDPAMALEYATDELPRDGKIIELAAKLELSAPAMSEAA